MSDDVIFSDTELLNVLKNKPHRYVLFLSGIAAQFDFYKLKKSATEYKDRSDLSEMMSEIKRGALPDITKRGMVHTLAMEFFTIEPENPELEPFEYYDQIDLDSCVYAPENVPSYVINGNYLLKTTYKTLATMEIGFITWDHLCVHEVRNHYEKINNQIVLTDISYPRPSEIISNISSGEAHETYDDEEITYTALISS